MAPGITKSALATAAAAHSNSGHRLSCLSPFTSGLPDCLEPEGELRAYPHYLEGFANELSRYIDITDDRIAPIVE